MKGDTSATAFSVKSEPLQEGRSRSILDFLSFFFFFCSTLEKQLNLEGLIASENCHFLFKALDSKGKF